MRELFQEKEKIIPGKMRELFQDNRVNYSRKNERIIPGKMRELSYKPKAGHSFLLFITPFFTFSTCADTVPR